MPTACGLLLTGGRSRRLGVDKASLLVDGATLAERGGSALTAVCDLVVEVGPGHTGLPTVREDPPGSGPLAAIGAGAAELTRRGGSGGRGPVLVLAVDLPRVTIELLELLRDWPGAPTVVPEAAGRLQPVCARYGTDALLAIESLLAGGVRSLRDLLDVVEHDVLAEPAWHAVASPDAFDDIDTPDDARRLGIDLRRIP